MRKVFVDIGAHTGETLRAALDPRWEFDEIHCVEPVPSCVEHLCKLADSRTMVHPFGLWSTDDTLEVHDPGSVGASLFSGKARSTETATCPVRDAATWWREIGLDTAAELFVKINVEGAEAEILQHLAAHSLLDGIDHLVIHLDVLKVPELAGRGPELINLLNNADIQWFSAEDIMFGRNPTEKTRAWLSWCHGGPLRRFQYRWLRRLEFALRVKVYELRRRSHSSAALQHS